MHLSYLPVSLLFTLSAFYPLSSSLPLADQLRGNQNNLAPRVTYSVVAIDGGSGLSSGSGSSPTGGPKASGSGSGTGTGTGSGSGSGSSSSPSGSGSGSGTGNQSPVTVILTAVETLPPATTTVYEWSPATITRITDTVLVIPSPGLATKTGISIVDISASPTTTASPVAVTGIASSLAVVSQPTTPSTSSPQTWPTASGTPYTTPTWSTNPSASPGLSTWTQSPSTTTTFATSYTPAPTIQSSSTAKTYDDGMWHTTYPPWNGTYANRAVRAR